MIGAPLGSPTFAAGIWQLAIAIDRVGEPYGRGFEAGVMSKELITGCRGEGLFG